MVRWAPFLTFVLAAWTAAAQPFEGYVGRLDASQLGEGWGRLTPAEMPSIPLEGATVSMLDCEGNCPDPAVTDAAGWFTFPDLGMESALLHFEPPTCAGRRYGVRALEPREEVFENGGRTVLGAKWPAGVEDTILRYMPLVANTIYIRREGEIPGLREPAAPRRQRLGSLGERPLGLGSLQGIWNLRARADARVRVSTATRLLA